MKKENKNLRSEIIEDDITFDDLAGNLNQPLMNKKRNLGELKFVALGGTQGVTMSCYVYEYKDECIVVDCGILMEEDLATAKIVPDLTYLKDKNIKALIVTHYHEDHLGSIPYYFKEFFSNCPIYGSPMTIAKVKQKILDELGDKVHPDYRSVKPEGEVIKIGNYFDIKFIHVTHLTLQSFSLGIKTPEGNIFHTGDYNFSPNPLLEQRYDFESVKELSKEGIMCVVGDSLEVYRKDIDIGEDTVKEALLRAMKQYKKKIFVTLFSSSTARVDSIVKIAHELGRKVCIIGRAHRDNFAAAQSVGFLKDVAPVTEEEAGKLKDSEVCYIIAGCQGEPNAALTRLCSDNLRYTKLNAGDAVIFSASIVPGAEKDVLYLYGKIIDKGADLFTMDDDSNIHAHGHNNRDGFIHMYKDLIKPKALLPVHGDKIHQFIQLKLAREYGVKNGFMLNNGEVVAINHGNPEIIEKVEAGALVVEGNRTVAYDDQMFKNRKKAFYDGAVFTTLSIDTKGYLKEKPLVSSLGVFETDETGFIKKEIEVQIVSALKELSKGAQKSTETLTQATTTAIRKALKNTGKKPRVIVHFVYK